MTLLGIVVLLLICLVTLGVLTPVSTLAFLYTTRLYEAEISSDSLATELLSLLLSLLVVASAGARRSVDAALMRRAGWIGAPVRALYRFLGIPSTRGVRTILLLYFAALALMNLGGVVNHWYEDDWRNGRALQMIFSSSYMSRVWPLWRPFELHWPAVAAWTSWGLTMTQLVMQTTMLAMVWWRPTARLLILWGAVFFVSSIIAMQLHFLGAFELLLWIAIFHRPRPSAAADDQSFTRRTWSERSILAAGATLLTIFVAHEASANAGVEGIEEYPFPKLRQYIDFVGIHSPRVFNRNDLLLGDAWCVVYRNNRERLPYNGENGERLAWLQSNDLLLYRSSVRWRNEFNPETFFNPDRDGVRRLQQLVAFDHRRRHIPASSYIVDYYTSMASHTDLPPAARFERKLVGNTQFSCSGEGNGVHCTVVSSIRLPGGLTDTQSDSNNRP